MQFICIKAEWNHTILGFLGKGGSGKSSLASQTALFLNQVHWSVLAIDADHNLDLSYNLSGGEVPSLPYFSQSLTVFERAVGLTATEKYPTAFLRNSPVRFTLTPLSVEIQTYSHLLQNGIRLMSAGPQTETVLYGKACSHSLSTPLKILLPLLHTQEHEVVIVDEKAGADGVSTGIVTGIDVGVIVCEPALHSVKTAKQIAALMDFYDTPYLFVGNKIASSEDQDFITTALEQAPAAFLPASTAVKREPSAPVPEWTQELQCLFEKAGHLNQNNRLERTVKKFKRNHEFAHS
jgi:CO dehydrogenase nickel-insertion accessory protein CooC1